MDMLKLYVICLCSILVLLAVPAGSIEIPTEVTISIEASLSEALASSVLSYYQEKPFKTFSLTVFRAAFSTTPAADFGINTLYMAMIAEIAYMFGSLLGYKGSFGWRLGGAYLPPIAFYMATDILTMDASRALSAAQLGVVLAPIVLAVTYHWSTDQEGFGRNRENADFVIAQTLGSYYGMAITGIGLMSLSRPPLTGVERFVGATVLGASGGFSAYGIGGLRGNGDSLLRSTLLSGFAPSAIGATAGALLNRSREGGSHWLAGYYWRTLIFTDVVALIGYRIFGPE